MSDIILKDSSEEMDEAVNSINYELSEDGVQEQYLLSYSGDDLDEAEVIFLGIPIYRFGNDEEVEGSLEVHFYKKMREVVEEINISYKYVFDLMD